MPSVKVTNIGPFQTDGVTVQYAVDGSDPDYQISLSESAVPASAEFTRLNASKIHDVKVVTLTDPV